MLKNVFAVKTCGLPRITSVMRNLTLDPGDTARLKLCFCNFSFYLFFPSFDCEVDMKCMVSVRPYCSNTFTITSPISISNSKEFADSQVSYIQWYHTVPHNGSRKLIRTGSSAGLLQSFSPTSSSPLVI